MESSFIEVSLMNSVGRSLWTPSLLIGVSAWRLPGAEARTACQPNLRPPQIVKRRAPWRSIPEIVVVLLDLDLIHKVFVIAAVFGIPVMWMNRTKKTGRQHRASEQLIRLFR